MRRQVGDLSLELADQILMSCQKLATGQFVTIVQSLLEGAFLPALVQPLLKLIKPVVQLVLTTIFPPYPVGLVHPSS